MTEFLPMTMLSSEPVSAAKPHVAQSHDNATEPDQSFAATLAAEVNGKAPEKSAKASAKTRQNNATQAQQSKEDEAGQSSATMDTKSDITKSAERKEASAAEATEPSVDVNEPEVSADDAADTEHSRWLKVLEQSKSLHERLAQAEKANAGSGSTVGAKVDKIWPGMTASSAELKAAAEQQGELTSEEEQALAELNLESEPQNGNISRFAATGPQGGITLNPSAIGAKGTEHEAEELSAEQLGAKPLSDEEVKALKFAAQAGQVSAVPAELADKNAKQVALLEKTPKDGAQSSPDATTEKALNSPAGTVKKDKEPVQSKVAAEIEKSLKTLVSEQEKKSAVPDMTDMPVTVITQQSSMARPQDNLSKVVTLATTVQQGQTESDADTETLSAQSTATEPKLSVQAQSSAAAMAGAVKQSKVTSSEPKVTTEDVLKQAQSAPTAVATEQANFSSSGDSAKQGSADSLLTSIEQQKTSSPVVTETSSFSSQLKSTLDKINAGVAVAGREPLADNSQKQMDQLGQKLNLIQPEASNQLKEKMLMMVKDKVHTAEIRLDPSELGSMQVKISLQQDQMSVQFMVQHNSAKELMEQQMPKLKELLQQQGIELSQGSVQQQSQSSSGQEGGRRAATANTSGMAQSSSEEFVESGQVRAKSSDRVVDYYA